ncbi:hypothetical protein RDWZM_001286 [Blomia tropicalis]|uniref:Rab-GAP TBC domain-containing protein n=1 Tax=Blomia tropicalis TaxID=40697 RepID=A0A9Q0RQH1_BLOTA|nr:hypothetical protein RDWZM_001286 [Blomia tropicalis]
MDFHSSTHNSSFCSLDNALENVGQDLVYDPNTKQLCLRNVSNTSNHLGKTIIKDLNSPDSNHSRKQSDGDSGYGECFSQKSVISVENRLDGFPITNEDVDDLNLSPISSPDKCDGRFGKPRLFIQNVIGRLTTSTDPYHNNYKQSNNSKIVSNPVTTPDSIIGNNALNLGRRPPNLPPKTEEEERRHHAEFVEIVKQAKKRELKEKAKLKNRSNSNKFQQEEVISESIRSWTNDILPSWPLSNSSRRTRELWWNGIPSPIRSKVWSLAIGNDLNITDELFRICVERSNERIWTKQFVCRRSSNPCPTKKNDPSSRHRRIASGPISNNHKSDNQPVSTLTKKLSNVSITKDNECAKYYSDCEEEDDEDKDETVSYLIQLDVSRTFPQLGLFQKTGPYHQSLSDVLAAYAVYRPDLGYCQGMSFLAAMLLLNLESPTTAFTAFANLLNNELLLCFYRLDQERMSIVYSYYERQLQCLMPRLAEHFRTIGLTVDLFIVDQMYTIFSRSLPLECVCRVWDLFLRDGNEFIFRASLAILVMYEDILLQLEFVRVAQFLARLPDDMNVDRYFNTIASIKLVPPQLSIVLETKQQNQQHQHSKVKCPESNTSSLVKKLFNLH